MAVANAGYYPHGSAVSSQSIVRHDEALGHYAAPAAYAIPLAYSAPAAYAAPLAYAGAYEGHDEYVRHFIIVNVVNKVFTRLYVWCTFFARVI